jgi:hypothetical protein
MGDRTETRGSNLVRIGIGLTGVAMLAWGVVLGLPLVPDPVPIATWFLGGPVLHDLLFAPLVGVLGVAAARWLAPRWRTPVKVGAVLSGVLGLLAVPYLWRPYGTSVNPGLHDRSYGPGLLTTLAVVWLGVLLAGLIRRRKSLPR